MKKFMFLIIIGFSLIFALLQGSDIFDSSLNLNVESLDSLVVITIHKAGGVIDTIGEIDTLGNVRMLGTFLQDNIWLRAGDTLWFVDATLADTSWMTNNGNYLTFGGDLAFKYLNDAYYGDVVVSADLVMSGIDVRIFKTNAYRWYIDYDDDDALAYIYFHGENEALKADSAGAILEWTGDGGYKSSCFDGDSLNIGDEKWLKKLDFGSNVFGDAKTADTVLISGATASDLYLITAKDSIPAGYWTTISKVDTLIVNSSAAENDTPFIWWRFK